MEWDPVGTQLCALGTLRVPCTSDPENSWEPGGTWDLGTLHTSGTTHADPRSLKHPLSPSHLMPVDPRSYRA